MLRQFVKTQTLLTLTGASASGTSGVLLFQEEDMASVTFRLSVTVASGTSPTLDGVIMTSPDGGTTMYDCIRFAQITASTANPHFASAAVDYGALTVHGAVGSGTISANSVGVPILGRQVKFDYTIGGTSPFISLQLDAILASMGRI